MLSLDLFNSRYEKRLHEGAVDDTITRTQAHLMEPLSRRAADIRTQIRTGKLSGAELDKLEKEYEDLVQKRLDIMLDRQPKNEQQVPSRQDPFAYVKPEPKGIGDTQDPRDKMAQLQQKAKKGPLANVAAGIKAFVKGEPEPMGEQQELGRRGIGMANMKALQATVEKGFARTVFQFPTGKYVVGEDDTDKMADYYNALDSAGRTNFVYNVLGDGAKFIQMSRELGIQATPVEPQQPELPGMPQGSPQRELPLSEKKKSNSDDLEAGDIKVARELQKLRAQYPAAKSDVEAVARAEIDSTERSQQQLAAIRGANEKQDALLKQLVALDQEQGREINTLDKENNSLEQRLAQVQATNDRLQQAVGTMTGNKKAATNATVTNVPQTGSRDIAQGGIIDVDNQPTAKPDEKTAGQTDKPPIRKPAQEPTNVVQFRKYDPPEQLVKAPKVSGSDVNIEEHGGGIGPRQHWQDLMQEGQPQELINRYLAIDAENDVEAVRAAIQAISKDPALSVTSKSRLLGQIGMIIRRHRLPLGRAYYQFMRQYMEDINETALNPQDPQGDYEAKRRALHDLSLNKDVDQQAVLQRRLDLDREAKAKGLAETVTNVKAGMAEIYRRLAPKIERHRDSFLAGQLYDELENYAELHGAEGEFKRMMSTARNRAHMEYDTNPGGFQNWFWFLPFEDEQLEEGLGDTLKSVWREIKTYVVDFVANAVGLPDDQRREVFVKAGNTFSNEVIKLLANHPARDKLIPMVREIGGYMAKARTLKELNSLMDKAELFLADVDAGKFDPPVAKTLPSFGDRQGMTENASSVSDKDITDLIHDVAVHLIFNKQRMSIDEADPKLVAIEVQKAYKMEGIPFTQSDLTRVQNIFPKVMRRLRKGFSPEVKDSEDIDEQGVTEGTDDVKKRMSKLEALALAANRAGDDAKCKMYQQRIQSLKQKLSQSMSESLKPGEYHIHTVYFKDGTKKRIRVTSDEFDVVGYYKQRGQAVDRVDYDYQIHSDMTEAEKEPTTRQELLNRVDKIQRMMTQERNPANLQILRKELEMLKQRYQHLKEDSDGGEAVEMAIMRRMLVAHTDLIVEFGLDKVVDAIEEVAYNVGDVDEIGSSDVSGWVNQVRQILGADA